jgi:hypothetical protein
MFAGALFLPIEKQLAQIEAIKNHSLQHLLEERPGLMQIRSRSYFTVSMLKKVKFHLRI